MNLLCCLDHKFLTHEGAAYDLFQMGAAFFADYLAVFDTITVLARSAAVERVPENAVRVDSERVTLHQDVRSANRLAWLFLARWGNRSLIRREVLKADSVVVRVPSQLGGLAALEAHRQRVPFLAEVVGDPEESIGNLGSGLPYRLLAVWEKLRLKRILNLASAATYVSREYLQEKYPVAAGVPVDSISSIRLPREEIKEVRSYLAPPQPLRIVYVASLISYKRHRDLIAACSRLSRKGCDLEVHLAGDGPQREDLEAAAARAGIQDKINFHGHISERAALLDLLDRCDIFIIPSATEGLPRAVIEAMARGLPCLGTAAGGIPELIRPEDLFPVGDVAELARLIEDRSKDLDSLWEMSRHSIAQALQFTAEELSTRRRRIYRALADRAAESA